MVVLCAALARGECAVRPLRLGSTSAASRQQQGTWPRRWAITRGLIGSSQPWGIFKGANVILLDVQAFSLRVCGLASQENQMSSCPQSGVSFSHSDGLYGHQSTIAYGQF